MQLDWSKVEQKHDWENVKHELAVTIGRTPAVTNDGARTKRVTVLVDQLSIKQVYFAAKQWKVVVDEYKLTARDKILLMEIKAVLLSSQCTLYFCSIDWTNNDLSFKQEKETPQSLNDQKVHASALLEKSLNYMGRVEDKDGSCIKNRCTTHTGGCSFDRLIIKAKIKLLCGIFNDERNMVGVFQSTVETLDLDEKLFMIIFRTDVDSNLGGANVSTANQPFGKIDSTMAKLQTKRRIEAGTQNVITQQQAEQGHKTQQKKRTLPIIDHRQGKPVHKINSKRAQLQLKREEQKKDPSISLSEELKKSKLKPSELTYYINYVTMKLYLLDKRNEKYYEVTEDEANPVLMFWKDPILEDHGELQVQQYGQRFIEAHEQDLIEVVVQQNEPSRKKRKYKT